ncbi:MAG: WecB/TagA/CpsF family glycosyltransferase [Desulfobulbaceae bacterium]|nr:WecB/TagA/CpsF family glycosyltransferase [Desulfobulbaceae bacterium]
MSSSDLSRATRISGVEAVFAPDIESVELFGIPVEAATLDQALDRVHKAIVGREQLQLGMINAAKVVNMRRSPELRTAVLDSDIIYADGMAVVWASRLLGKPLPNRVTGIDLMYGILKRGQQHNYRIFCLGAKPAVVKTVRSKFQSQFPGIEIVGHADGYFDDQHEKDVARSIRDAKPDVLFVAITSPKKERFMANWAGYMGVPVVHGVGGSFDVVAGLVERAPESWQKLGLEWLYRVKQEPRRLIKRYFVTNSLFLLMLLREKIRRFSSP